MNDQVEVAQIQHNTMYWISVILTILFAWVVFPIKWIKKARHAARKRHAFAKAKKQSRRTLASVFVCQWDDMYFVGTRTELKREIDRKYKNIVSNRISHYLDVDFRNAVIACAKNGSIVMQKAQTK